MKFLISFVILGVFFSNAQAVKVHCDSAQTTFGPKMPKEWVTMDPKDTCLGSMIGHIQNELDASLTYMAMGAHFSKDTINRPGFSEFFFKSASEEREHAIKLIEYMSMRGAMTSNLTDLIPNPFNSFETVSWDSGAKALKAALVLETTVTSQIRNIIVECEKDSNEVDGKKNKNGNDYHLVDYLTGEFLEEQYKGQRDLAGKLSTLSKLVNHQGSLGEFIFDKKMLNGEI